MARTAKTSITGSLRKRTTKEESFKPMSSMSPGMGDLKGQPNSLLTPIPLKASKTKRQKKVKKLPKHPGDTFNMP